MASLQAVLAADGVAVGTMTNHYAADKCNHGARRLWSRFESDRLQGQCELALGSFLREVFTMDNAGLIAPRGN